VTTLDILYGSLSLSCGWVMQSLVQVHRPILMFNQKSSCVFNEYNGRALLKTEELVADVLQSEDTLPGGQLWACNSAELSYRR
jgi:hypothetical protein